MLKNGHRKRQREQREKERELYREPASAEGWFCFRNWNVSRLDFYFQFTFQIQLPKLFDLSPCLLTRKRTLGLLSWELGAHVERLARIHILAKFSHTKGPAREKRKDESGSRRDFKGRAAAPGPAQAPPSADIRRDSRARAAFPRASPTWGAGRGTRRDWARRAQGWRLRPCYPPAFRGRSPCQVQAPEKSFSERRDKNVTSCPRNEQSCGPQNDSSSHLHSCSNLGIPHAWEPGFPSQRAAQRRGRVAGPCLARSAPLCLPRVAGSRALSYRRDSSPSWAPLGRVPSPPSWQRGGLQSGVGCAPCPRAAGGGGPLDSRARDPYPARQGCGARPALAQRGESRRRAGGVADPARSSPARLRRAADANRRRPRGSPTSAGGRIWERLFHGPTSSLIPRRVGG